MSIAELFYAKQVANAEILWRVHKNRAVSTVKSSSCPGRSCRTSRIASSARDIPDFTSPASYIFTEIDVVLRRP